MIDKSQKTLIIIPAFNAGKYLVELTERIRKAVPDIDIMIVNDGSVDNTKSVLDNLSVKSITNVKNMGKGYSLRRGFSYAITNSYEYVITLDADLQHLPEELPLFMECDSTADLLIGTREITLNKMSFPRWLSNNLTSLMVSIFFGRRIRDSQSGYRMIATRTLKMINTESSRFDFETEILHKAGLIKTTVTEVPVSTVYKEAESNINHLADTARFIKLLWKRTIL